MSKYIDADKLIAEIKRYKNKADERLKIKGRTYAEEQKDLALQNLCGNLLHFISSLQQEQPEVCEPEYGPYARQYPKSKVSQEQSEADLEKEIENYTETLYHETFGNGQGTLDEFDWEDIAQVIDDTARYFYNLNKNEA